MPCYREKKPGHDDDATTCGWSGCNCTMAADLEVEAYGEYETGGPDQMNSGTLTLGVGFLPGLVVVSLNMDHIELTAEQAMAVADALTTAAQAAADAKE